MCCLLSVPGSLGRAKGEPLTDPMTKEELPSAKLRPKQALKERIRKYLKRHPERRPQWA